MKAGGLLLLLLIGVGLYLYLSASSAQTTLKASKPARELATEVSGQGMKESFSVEPVDKDGKTIGLEITKLDPDGLLAKIYDVKVGDRIVGIGPFSIKDTDPEMLKAQVLEAGAHPQPLIVIRAGQKLELAHHGAASGNKGDRSPGGNLNPLNAP